MHPQSTLTWIDPEIGFGVFATAFIPRGTLVWALDWFDVVLSPEQVDGLAEPLHTQIERYSFVDGQGRYVLCWDFGRYLNHACNPASRSVGDNLEVAVRDIYPGDELTCDYGVCNMSTVLRCRCGTPNCRGEIHPDDAVRYAEIWDQETRQAWERALEIPQPLLPFIRAEGNDVALTKALSGGPPAVPPSSRQFRAPRIKARDHVTKGRLETLEENA